MTAGRPPKLSVVSTGKIGKEKKKQREIAESKLKVKRDLHCPDWLTPEGKKEFERIVEESEPLEIIDNMDLTFLAMYSDAYANYTKIANLIREQGFTDEENNLNKNAYDLVKLQDRYKNTILQCSSKLGLATSDRLRLVIPKGEEKPENPFYKFL